MKRNLPGSIAMFVFCLTCICLSLDSTTSAKANGGSFGGSLEEVKVEGSGYEMQIPADWQAQKKPSATVDVILLSPIDGPQDMVRENINVAIEDGLGNMGLEEYADRSVASLKMAFDGMEVLAREQQQVGGVKCSRLTYKFTMNNGLKLHNDAFLFVKDGKAYVVTLTLGQGESRQQHLERMRGIADSFKLK